jgi:hypothetical protein
MKRMLLVALVSAFAAGSAMAADSCSNPTGKDGKALSGAAKASSIKSCCEKAATAAKLSGAAKTSNVNKCIKDAG